LGSDRKKKGSERYEWETEERLEEGLGEKLKELKAETSEIDDKDAFKSS